MARKIEQAAAPAAAAPVRICFERILPDEVDTEKQVRRNIRTALSGGKKLDASGTLRVSRMAVVLSKKWGSGAVVKCRFTDGSKTQKKKVEAVTHGWEKFADVELKFVTKGSAEVRISFVADDGSWSAVGRDALNRSYFPLHQPTMNYGWLRDDTEDAEYQRVVLHEFGHALGCIHEHQQPKFNRKWNEAAVMKYFSGPPNFWSEEDIRFNVLEKYSAKGIAATVFDPKSIMLYDFDANLFSDGLGRTNSNKALSVKDKAMIKSMYP